MLVGKELLPHLVFPSMWERSPLGSLWVKWKPSFIQSSLGEKETLNTNSEFLKEILGIPSSFILGNELSAEHMNSSVNLSSINFKGVLAKTSVTFFLSSHFLFGSLLLRTKSLSCSFQR